MYGLPTKYKCNLDGYYLNPYSINKEILSSNKHDAPSLAGNIGCIIAKWYVEDIGIVPRWSKFHKELETKRAELLNKQN